MSKRALITGASGFVGSNLARRLVKDGHEVHLLLRDQFQPWRLEGLIEHARVHLVDLGNAPRVASLVAGIKPDWIFHLAASGAYPYQVDYRPMVETNVLHTMNLLHACLGCGFEVFVNTGSSSEYGYKDHAPAETELAEPNSEYAVTKLAATNFCRYFAAKHGVRVPTLRLYSVYGPFEEPTRLIPTLISNGLAGKLPSLVSPDTGRDFVYSEDVCDAFLSVATSNGSDLGAIYNVASGHQSSLRDVVALTRNLLDIGTEPVWNKMAPRTWDTGTWVGNHERITRECGWRPRTPLADGLEKTVQWFRENPHLWALYGYTKPA